MPTRRNKREKINPEDIDLNKSLETVQDVVEYLESDFISMEDSKTEGYDIDIYVNFKYNLYEENISKEPYFQNFYEIGKTVEIIKEFGGKTKYEEAIKELEKELFNDNEVA